MQQGKDLYASMKLARKVDLENGLTVSFFTHCHRYFGDYHQVRVEITCEVPIEEEYFSSLVECNEARAALGMTAVFRRKVERMGVPTADLETTLESIIANFSEHSLSYLSTSDFPGKLIATELAASSRGIAKGTYSG
jgi:hypothetical protein